VAHSVGLSEVFITDPQGRLLGHGSSRCVLLPVSEKQPSLPGFPEAEDGAPDPYRRPVVGEIAPQRFWDKNKGWDSFAPFWSGKQAWPPLAHLTGLHPVEVGDGNATCVLPASPWLANYAGIVYGGAIAMLADFSLSCAIWTTLDSPVAVPWSFRIDRPPYWVGSPR